MPPHNKTNAAHRLVDEKEFKRLVQDEAMKLPDLNIAVTGMSGRFPKSDSVNEFEENLLKGIDMIKDQDDSRFACGLWNLPPRAGRLKDLSKFDCEFFGFTQDDANYLDYQQRILYEVVYESIIDAGVNPTSLRGTKTGVFFGLHCNEFENAMSDDPAFKSKGYYAQFAVKVAQYFDFRGMTITFDAACASGFVGLYNAVEAIANGLVDQAIVCSSNIPVHPTGSYIFLQMQMLSPTGYSRFLDSRADGYVKSEACVSILLQRKDVAIRNYCSIMAATSSVDGYKSEGITFPSDKSQENLIRVTKELTGVSTNHIEYIEAHGTGTPAGDPQECRAISNVYFPQLTRSASTRFGTLEDLDEHEENEDEYEVKRRDEKVEATVDERKIGPLLLGSVKTNMGHSEAASGLCALAKVVLMLENELIYKGLHYSQPNNNIEALMEGKLKFVEDTLDLQSKIIPLSCYGFGGANVHCIVRANERPAIEFSESQYNSGETPRLIIMFGRSEQGLNYFFDELLNTKSRYTRNCLSDDFLALVDSLNSGQIDRLMDYRGYLVVDRTATPGIQLARNIKRCEIAASIVAHSDQQQQHDLGRPAHVQDCAQRECNFILPGLGCQWPGMASGLTKYKPFWSTIERLASLLKLYQQDLNLINLLTDPSANFNSSMCSMLVSIVAYQVALINIIRDQLKPNNKLAGIVGHSVGEISCAYAAGLFDEREAIMVAHHMGECLDKNKHLIRGKMVALGGVTESEALEMIAGYKSIRISCVNGPQSVTISGTDDEMDKFCLSLDTDNLFVKHIDSPIALHNEFIMTTQIKELLKKSLLSVLLSGTDYNREQTCWISSGPTTEAENNQANAEFFAEGMCKKVDFLGSLQQLADDSIALELGPSGAFESQLRQMETTTTITTGGKPGKGEASKFHYVKMMKHSTPADEQSLTLIKSIGELYQAGATFDLTRFQCGKGAKFPVRRQTPSLSSMFKWKHHQNFFVPRYPNQFSKSSAKSEVPVDIIQDRDKYMIGHCIEGRILFPATGYLFLIWRVFSFTKRQVYDASFHSVENELVPIEFHDVKLLRAVILGNRLVQLYIHYEEGTGKFEIKEGGSVVVEGYARSPIDLPNGLLYEHVRDKIEAEELELTLSPDDIYKQFRVSGYDYGETFRNIEAASSDGRYCRVKYNGYFATLTDSILQSIFLAIVQYAPSGGLFLPTRFDYVRFQPEIILKKIREAKLVFDLGDSSFNEKTKRETMIKLMQRDLVGPGGQQEQQEMNANGEATVKDTKPTTTDNKAEQEEPPRECLFDVYCDPLTGIIITDGIEMRGIKATPAPRRFDNNEVLLESYQFVKDFEDPIEDEHLTKYEQYIRPYVRVCDSMSMNLLLKICGDKIDDSIRLNGALERASSGGNSHNTTKSLAENQEEIADYKSKLLHAIHSPDATPAGEEEYDMKKNGDKMLMSVLDQLSNAMNLQNSNTIKDIVQKNRLHLMRDLIQNSLSSERFMRPLIEMVIENTCVKKMKLKMAEINMDDGIMRDSLQHLILNIQPTMSLDYSLAHPDLSRLSANSIGSSTKTYTLKDLHSLFAGNAQLRELDLIVYKDISCYSLPKQMIEQNGLAPVLTSLNGGVRLGGYVVILMRQKLTLAERVLLLMSEPELVGLSKRHLEELSNSSSGSSNNKGSASAVALNKIEQINAILAARCKLMMSEAKRNQMLCLAKKSDQNGCTVLLFKSNTILEGELSKSIQGGSRAKRVVLRIAHENTESINSWLEKLKQVFKPPAEVKEESGEKNAETTGDNEKAVVEITKKQDPAKDQQQRESLVWLCAVATKQNPISGLVGMMQALSKELGLSRLRCYYDCHTFKNKNEPISVEDIECCEKFQHSLDRDMIWNCVDSYGNFGSYRHFTINNYMTYEDCLCGNKQLTVVEAAAAAAAPQSRADSDVVSGAYVNNATRGDLSSFTWFEVPLKYINEKDRKGLIKVSYAALNFRDIMLATARLPLDALSARSANLDCLLGLEFSGHDINGKRVMGMINGRGIATHVLLKRSGIKIEIPDWLDMKEAATIPIVYSTAIMALIYRGKMQRGESVLIHAGSGGVGQAAIRLAAYFGVQIFTTVGSDEKRKFLLEEFADCLTDDHIFSSRDCNFEQQIMLATKGKGVDLVLNSLADDKLQASIRCLADGGRFLEIGKYDLSTNTKLELLKLDTNKSFHGILLDKIFDEDDLTPAFVRQLKLVLATIQDGLVKGYVKPIKHTVFKKDQIEEAFRYMATGKHIGKVLIEISTENDNGDENKLLVKPPRSTPMKCVPRFQLSSQKSYIVTGGLGGFGMELTKWLVSQGASYVLLTSRSGIKTGYQRSTLQRLELNNGTKFLIVDNKMADTTTEHGVEQLCEIAQEMSPIKEIGGIFHLAMVLKDSLLENMSVGDFELVSKPKLDTGKHLDTITRRNNLNLDYFVCFSSVTSGKGNAGQANYAYANSCLERICEKRRQHGLHGLAIQWGAIGDVGVAFENLGGNNIVIGGTIPQRMPSCLATLSKLLCSPFATCLSVLPVNRTPDSGGEKGDLVSAILHVLGIKDQSKVSDQANLGELGLDSLMAVEIRQYIEREYDLTLNIQEIRSLTIAKIKEINEKEKPVASKAGDKSISGENIKQDEQVKPVVREVQSYGAAPPPSENGALSQAVPAAAAAATNGNQTKVPPAQQATGLDKDILTNKSETIEAVLDKNNVSPFLPKLRLPRADYCRLNFKRVQSSSSSSSSSLSSSTWSTNRNGNGLPLVTNGNGASAPTNGNNEHSEHLRPIFFVPPIHGKFNKLKLVCTNIKRPCIGLHWNKRLGRVRSVQEAVEVYLDLLKRANWQREFNLPVDRKHDDHYNELTGEGERVVDLVGYSYGATIAFEMMLAIHKLQNRAERRLADGLADNLSGGLRAGKLILLDGTPKQIELGSQFLINLTRKRPLKYAEKVDEMLMLFMIAHTQKKSVDYLELQRSLASTGLENKVKLASQRLVKILGLSPKIPNKRIVPALAQDDEDDDDYDDFDIDYEGEYADEVDKLTEVADAMEAFCRKYESIANYKATLSLPTDCTLIRAEKIYIKRQEEKCGDNYNEDLDLSSVVKGKVKLYVMKGDHESFLSENQREIGEIITKHCDNLAN